MTLTKADIIQDVYNYHDHLTKIVAKDAIEAVLRLH